MISSGVHPPIFDFFFYPTKLDLTLTSLETTCLRNLEKQPSATIVRGARISFVTDSTDDDDDDTSRSTPLSTDPVVVDETTFWVNETPTTRSGFSGS